MADLKAFRATNNLYQKDISEFLGVSIGFISAIERGDSKLPAEQLAKLLANTNGWDTTYLTSEGNGSRIHNDYRQMTMSSNMEGSEFNAPIHNYSGFSEEEVQRRVNEKIAVVDADMKALETENFFLKQQNAELKAELERERKLSDRYLKMLEGMKVSD